MFRRLFEEEKYNEEINEDNENISELIENDSSNSSHKNFIEKLKKLKVIIYY